MQTDVSDWRNRVNIDPNIQNGVPVVRGRRVPLYALVGHMAGGDTAEEVADAYQVGLEDVRAALAFATYMLDQRGLTIPEKEDDDECEDGWVTLA
jgi:uncharacterized protein (DUF433 family)